MKENISLSIKIPDLSCSDYTAEAGHTAEAERAAEAGDTAEAEHTAESVDEPGLGLTAGH